MDMLIQGVVAYFLGRYLITRQAAWARIPGYVLSAILFWPVGLFLLWKYFGMEEGAGRANRLTRKRALRIMPPRPDK